MNKDKELTACLDSMVELLLKDSAPGVIKDVDWYDQEDARVRKSQLTNIKDEISIIKQMNDLKTTLQEDQAVDDQKEVHNEATVLLMSKARERLASAGIDLDKEVNKK